MDTSLRSCGYAVVEQRGSAMQALDHGHVRNPSKLGVADCLAAIGVRIDELLDAYAPGSVAIEGIFFCKNVKTAMRLGEARGVVIVAAARRGLPVYEYAPRRVKQAVVGYGQADKSQVRRMVQSLLHLPAEPQEDAGDALGIAICHLNSHSTHEALAPKTL